MFAKDWVVFGKRPIAKIHVGFQQFGWNRPVPRRLASLESATRRTTRNSVVLKHSKTLNRQMRKNIEILIRNWPLDIPFERAVRLNFEVLERLVDEGLTWSYIANVLTEAGARHKHGRPVSSRQINSVFLRTQKAAHCSSKNVDRPSGFAVAAIAIPEKIAPRIVKESAPSEVTFETSSSTLSQRLAEAQYMKSVRKSDFDD